MDQLVININENIIYASLSLSLRTFSSIIPTKINKHGFKNFNPSNLITTKLLNNEYTFDIKNHELHLYVDITFNNKNTNFSFVLKETFEDLDLTLFDQFGSQEKNIIKKLLNKIIYLEYVVETECKHDENLYYNENDIDWDEIGQVHLDNF